MTVSEQHGRSTRHPLFESLGGVGARTALCSRVKSVEVDLLAKMRAVKFPTLFCCGAG